MRDTLMAYLGLKDVLRQGWVNAGVEAPESVAALVGHGRSCSETLP